MAIRITAVCLLSPILVTSSACNRDPCEEFDCQVDSLAVGYDHNCVVLHDGQVRCWGRNDQGQLGYGHTENVGDDEHPYTAGPVPVGEPAISIDAGRHTCAILATGGLRCWGPNESGQLGYGHREAVGDDEEPECLEDVPGIHNPLAVTAGGHHTCVITSEGRVRCWGSNDRGQLGYGHTSDILDASQAPVVAGVDNAVGIDAGVNFTCAMVETSFGSLVCWGDNRWGLGYGEAHESCYAEERYRCDRHPTCCVGDDEPPHVFHQTGYVVDGFVSSVAAGHRHICAAVDNWPVLRCWGANESGQLGYGDTISRHTYSQDLGTPNFAIGPYSLGGAHSCSIWTEGLVRCGGRAIEGQTGAVSDEFFGDMPGEPAAEIRLQEEVHRVGAGDRHTCVLALSGAVYCFGDRSWGQTGAFGHTDAGPETPIPVRVLPDRDP